MTTMKTLHLRNVFWLTISAMLLALASCTASGELVDHAFSFDAVHDSSNEEVLDYRYGASKQPGARPTDSELKDGRVRQGTNINGEMLRGDSLYVKWRIKSTADVYEDTVDLRRLLPADMAKHRIHFVVKGPQLYVYLISPERLNPNPCPPHEELRRLGKSAAPDDKIFAIYCYRKINRIYPLKVTK